MKLRAVQGDITALEVDAIVNAANAALAGGGGVDGAIHRAGGPSILAECRAIVAERGECRTGEAVITFAGDLPADHVIHTVGPIWGSDPEDEQDAQLAACYRNSLTLADAYEIETLAFPNISTGVYGFPKPRAAEVAVAAVRAYGTLPTNVQEVTFVCFDDENMALYEALLS